MPSPRHFSRGTLLEAETHRLRILLDSGRTVELDPRAYDRLAHGYAATVHKAQGATVDRAYVLADRGFDRNLSYVALTRHRHQLALYVDQETFASGEQLRRVFARDPRKDLVQDYRPANAAGLTLEPLPVEQTLDESWFPPVEPSAQELTPERLDRLQHALRKIDQWDEISARLSDVDQARRQLPFGGSLSNLELKIRELERAPWQFDRDLGLVYRQPETAREMFDQHASEHGPTEASTCRSWPAAYQPTSSRPSGTYCARTRGNSGRYERRSKPSIERTDLARQKRRRGTSPGGSRRSSA